MKLRRDMDATQVSLSLGMKRLRERLTQESDLNKNNASLLKELWAER